MRMKKSATIFLLLPALAFFVGACEEHRASELAKIDESVGPETPGAEREQMPSAPSEKPSTESSPAPKFFQH